MTKELKEAIEIIDQMVSDWASETGAPDDDEILERKWFSVAKEYVKYKYPHWQEVKRYYF